MREWVGPVRAPLGRGSADVLSNESADAHALEFSERSTDTGTERGPNPGTERAPIALPVGRADKSADEAPDAAPLQLCGAREGPARGVLRSMRACMGSLMLMGLLDSFDDAHAWVDWATRPVPMAFDAHARVRSIRPIMRQAPPVELAAA